MPSYLPRIRFTRRFLRITGAIVGFILLLLALAAWQVPEITRRTLTRDVAAMLGREVQVGRITFNPFSLTLRVHDFAVAQPGGAQPLLAIAEVDASASWKSLFWFAPVVDALVLREPRGRWCATRRRISIFRTSSRSWRSWAPTSRSRRRRKKTRPCRGSR